MHVKESPDQTTATTSLDCDGARPQADADPRDEETKEAAADQEEMPEEAGYGYGV